MEKLKTRTLYSRELLESRNKELAKEILATYPDDGKPIICVCVLRGAVLFYADLMKSMDDDRIVFDFLTISSYVSEETTGVVQLVQDVRSNVKDAHVLIVEDIVDSGYSLEFSTKYFKSKGAASVKSVVLLDKPQGRRVEIDADFVAFTLPRKAFIVGYGLDLDQKYRNLDCIKEVIE